jgi:hypothetical protein
MTVRVDLEALKKLTLRVQGLELDARRVRKENGTLLLKVQELRNTIEGLCHHMNCRVDLTPTGRDSTQPGKRPKRPIQSEKDVDALLDSWALEDTPVVDTPVVVEARLAESKAHWTKK